MIALQYFFKKGNRVKLKILLILTFLVINITHPEEKRTPMKPTILITGGAGYIGSHIAYKLSQKGHKIIIIDKLVHDQPFNHPWATLIKKDYADTQALKDIFTTYKIDTVIHCAAYAELGESVVNPLRFYDNNVSKTITLLKTMFTFNIKKIIFSSSCSVYGIPQYLPLTEKHPKNPMNPYGKTKHMAEMIFEDFDQAYGLKYVALRFFNVAGALSKEGLGEYHKPETHIIPLLLRATHNQKPFYIFGTDYPTRDGSCIRDYLHVLDIAHAHELAFDYLNSGNPSDCFNLGTGHGFSVKEVIAAAERITQIPTTIIEMDRRAGDPPCLVADYSKARTVLGWKPQHSELNSMIQSAYEFHFPSPEKNSKYEVRKQSEKM